MLERNAVPLLSSAYIVLAKYPSGDQILPFLTRRELRSPLARTCPLDLNTLRTPLKTIIHFFLVVLGYYVKTYLGQVVNPLTAYVKIFRGCFNTELEKRVIGGFSFHNTQRIAS